MLLLHIIQYYCITTKDTKKIRSNIYSEVLASEGCSGLPADLAHAHKGLTVWVTCRVKSHQDHIKNSGGQCHTYSRRIQVGLYPNWVQTANHKNTSPSCYHLRYSDPFRQTLARLYHHTVNHTNTGPSCYQLSYPDV